MKRNSFTTLLLACIISSFLLVSGCSKKNVVPPDSTMNGDSSSMSGGNDINYPSAEGGGFSEDNLPAEGTLDDSTNDFGSLGGANDPRHMADQQSDEYKKAHGRSSANLSPIYFDFDQAGVGSSMTDTLIQNADYLNSIPNAHVIIEGNSDERGTNEYNLALGERRAINTQQYLVNLGVDPARMRTVSFGEEKPLFLGQSEEDYKYNRRVDFGLE